MVCTRCGIIGADARPNWKEQPPRETLTGVQWRSDVAHAGGRRPAERGRIRAGQAIKKSIGNLLR
jgi:hypothetical protein